MTGALHNENELLLACARSILREEDRSRIQNIILSGIDWDCLALLAYHHKLAPLLYKHLPAVCPDQVPLQTKNELKGCFSSNSLRNINNFAALNQIIRLFENNGIETISIKGPLFNLQYLGDISLRSSWDIDIVVSKKAFRDSIKLLQSVGYRFLPDNIPEKYFLKFAELHHHARMEEDSGTIIEIHWRLSSHYGARILDYEALLPYIETYDVQGYNFPTLNHEMMLVYLALHAQKHCWQRYDYLLCISEVLNHASSIDWQAIHELAAILKMKKVVFFAIYMARNLLGASVDSTVLKKNRSLATFADLEKEHQQNWNLINWAATENEGKEKLEIIYPMKLHLINRIQDVVRRYYGNYFLPGEKDWESFPVAYPLSCIYYLTRPGKKLYRFFRRLLFKT